MNFDKVEITVGMILFTLVAGFISLMAGFVASEAWRASEKAAAYKAYVDCLHAMKAQPVDVQQTFCGKIREQL